MRQAVNFFLDKAKLREPTYIFLYHLCNDGMLKNSTKIKRLTTDWDAALQKPVDQKKNKSIIAELVILDSIVEKFTESCRLMTVPVTKENLKESWMRST